MTEKLTLNEAFLNSLTPEEKAQVVKGIDVADVKTMLEKYFKEDYGDNEGAGG